MPPISLDDVRFVILLLVLIGVAEPAWMAVRLLERCDRHLRALHVQLLEEDRDERAPFDEDDRAGRRDALGLDDGYPGAVHKSARGVLLTWLVVYGVAWWWLAR